MAGAFLRSFSEHLIERIILDLHLFYIFMKKTHFIMEVVIFLKKMKWHA